MLNKYVVGEDNPIFPYDYKYSFYIADNDKVIGETLKKGYLFEKYITMTIYNFCKKGDTILDVGANIGSITIPCAKYFNVYAFEPFNFTFNILKKNIEINNVNVKLYNKAVGHTNTVTTLSDVVLDEKHNVTKLDSKEKINYGAVQIGINGQETEMITLDSLIDEIDKVSLIKVDTEGLEPLVFYGAKNIINRDLPIIIFEKNWQIISKDTIKKMNLGKEINFDIIEYCEYLGYNKIFNLRGENYALIPPKRIQVLNDLRFQYWQVEHLHLYIPKSYFLYQLLKIDWKRDYKNIETKIPKNKTLTIEEFAKNVFSLYGEDGILDFIFKIIKPNYKIYVDFLADNGVNAVSRYLRERKGWDGIMISKKYKNKYIGLIAQGDLSSEELVHKYIQPKNFDLLISDEITWKTINYNPLVVVIYITKGYKKDNYIDFGDHNGVNYFVRKDYDTTTNNPNNYTIQTKYNVLEKITMIK